MHMEASAQSLAISLRLSNYNILNKKNPHINLVPIRTSRQRCHYKIIPQNLIIFATNINLLRSVSTYILESSNPTSIENNSQSWSPTDSVIQSQPHDLHMCGCGRSRCGCRCSWAHSRYKYPFYNFSECCQGQIHAYQ